MLFRRLVGLTLTVVSISFVATAIAPSRSAQAYSTDVAGAQTYANDFCPDVTYPEDKIADYMWVSAPGGGNQFSIQDGNPSQQVDVTINFYATYCKNWPQGYTNGAKDLKVMDGFRQRLASSPANVTYGPKTTGPGARSEWGVGQYAGKLDVSGWGTGWHSVCTSFTTTTTRPGVSFIDSPSACFSIYLTRQEPWTINGQSYVDNENDKIGRQQGNPALTAAPGETLTWDHDLRNSSAYNMDRTIRYDVDRSGFGNGWNGIKDPIGDASGNAGVLFVAFGKGAAYTTYTVTASDGGRTLCQNIAWLDKSWDQGIWGQSLPACAFIPFNYNLSPSVAGLNSGTGTVGGPIPVVTPQVDNSLVAGPGKTTDSPPADWQLHRVEVPPGGNIPMTQQEDANSPCDHFSDGKKNSCTDKGQGTQAFRAGITTLAQLNGEMVNPATPVGTRICYTLSVKPYATGAPAGNWRHSAPDCLTVSKSPKVQVWGGDLHTRGKILTQTTTASVGGTNKIFGSWVEYGGFSVGTNINFATGSGLNNGSTNTMTPADAWNQLTFANVNTDNTASYGMYSLPGNLPTVTSQFIGPATGGAANSDLGTLSSGTYTVGDFTIHGSDIGPGKSIIIVSSGTVTIDGNITYRGSGPGDTFSSVTELPQVIIIAPKIDIMNAATQLDAWLLTKSGGAINTCADVPLGIPPLNAPLNSTVCNNLLTVNGPVMTPHLYLRRTAGSDTVADAGAPAELFNLRPDTFLWAYARASQAGKAQTVYSVELPPRF